MIARLLLCLLTLVIAGCFRETSPTDEIRDSLLEFGKQNRGGGPIAFETDVLITRKKGQEAGFTQEDTYTGIVDGLYRVHDRVCKAYSPDKEIRFVEKRIGNPQYTATMLMVDGHPNLKNVTQRSSSDAAHGTIYFFNLPIEALVAAENTVERSMAESGSARVITVRYGERMAGNRSQYSELEICFDKVGQYWLPQQISAKMIDDHVDGCVSRDAIFDWEVGVGLPFVKCQTHTETFSSGYVSEAKTTETQRQLGVSMNRSLCFLGAYGMIEPEFGGNTRFRAIVWGAIIVAILLTGGVFLRQRRKR
ncbi:MAG: hypothetical protein SGJ20_07840 [Planctomycetota bacterium]|nr:hypothetical protein [Planctomycetota bacterium]